MINEEFVEKRLISIVKNHGWAENRFLHTARILRIILPDVESKELRNSFRHVIKYLEESKFE